MKKLIFLLIIFLCNECLAHCSNDQIDINSASAEELDKIIWVGPATAEKIINGRPFESVDSLINISGIGKIKLADIKKQGLACVNEEIDESNKENKEKTGKMNKKLFKEIKEKPEEIELETIKLDSNTKNIKRENNKKDLNKSDYAKYGFVIFCILLGFLFIFKKKNPNKNEFDE